MKAITRILCSALVVVFIFSLGGSVFAAEPQAQVTKDFIDLIDTVDGITYTVGDPVEASDGTYDIVRIRYEGELSEYSSNVSVLFQQDGSEAQLMMYRLIYFNEEDLADVLAAVNDVNARSTGIKFYVDQSDNSVTAEFMQLLPENGGAELVAHAFGFMIGLTDSVYEEIEQFSSVS